VCIYIYVCVFIYIDVFIFIYKYIYNLLLSVWSTVCVLKKKKYERRAAVDAGQCKKMKREN
jgi:hypothetical protein